MSGREDLKKLFEAALDETVAPSRFGPPDSKKLAAPAAFSKASAPLSIPLPHSRPIPPSKLSHPFRLHPRV